MGSTAVIYCRISQDATDQGLGVQRQEQDCRQRAGREGLEVIKVYTDNDIGASNLSKKPRPQYDSMIQAVRAGGVDVILAYSNSRLTRRNRELEDLITLHESTGVLIKTIASGDDDLSTAQGRMVARIKASVDAAEAEQTGERVKRQIRQRVEEGRPRHNRYRTYGFNRDWSHAEDEAARIKDAFSRVAGGQSVTSVLSRWKEEGVVVGGGKALYHSTVKNILTNPLYAGLMQHKGEIVGKAKVEPIVTEALFNATQSALEGTSTKRTGKYSRKYLLSGLVLCGKCGFTMAGKARKGTNYNYECSKAVGGCGAMSVSGRMLEPIALSYVRHQLILGWKPPKTVDHQPAIDEVDAELKIIQDAIAEGSMRVIDVAPILKDLSVKKRGLEALAAEAASDDEVSSFADWDSFVEGTIYEQIATVRRHVKGLVVNRAKSKAWNPSRVTLYTSKGTEVNGQYIRIQASSGVVASNRRK